MPEVLKKEVVKDETFWRYGKWIMLGIFISFAIGVTFFVTIGMERIGDPIPEDSVHSPTYRPTRR